MNNKNNNLIEILRRFNRKERFFLVGIVLGNTNFSLGKDFKMFIENRIGTKIEGDVFSAMDYHLDWINVSLKIWTNEFKIGELFLNKNDQINKNQEDIDFIIVFKSSGKYHIVLLEAKAETGWTNKQMNSKVKRFREIFGDDGKNIDNIIPHFFVMSPRESVHLHTTEWPAWMKTDNKSNWIKLQIPDNFYKVTRCDKTKTASKHGEFCVVSETKT